MGETFNCRVCGHERPSDQAVQDGELPSCKLCWTIKYYELDAKAVAKVKAEVLALQAKRLIQVSQQYGFELKAIQALAKKSMVQPPAAESADRGMFAGVDLGTPKKAARS